MAEGLQIHLGGGVAVDVVARGGVLLVARHTRDGVVQDDDGRIGSVVGDVDQTRHARVHEGGVADDGHGALLGLGATDLVEAVDARHRRAHAQHRVNGVEGLGHAQGVAADVTDDGGLVLGQGVEQASVRTARAHDGRTDGDGFVSGNTLGHLHAEHAADEVLGELALHGEEILAVHGKTQSLAVVLNDGIQLLDDHQTVHLGGEVQNQLFGQGIDHTQLEDGSLVSKDLLDVAVAGARADDTDLGTPHLHAVDGGGLGVLDQGAGTSLHHGMAADGVGGSHDVLLRSLDIGLDGDILSVLYVQQALGVGDAGAHTEQEGGIELLRQLKGQHGVLSRLGGIRGLQHGDLGGDGVVAGVLLVLGGVHTGVVGHAQHQTAVHTGVGHGIQGVGGHVEAYVLHGAGGTGTGEGSAEGDFKCHLLVGGPLAVHLGADVAVLGGVLGDLGGGGAGVAGHETAARLVQASGHGLVAEHEGLLHDGIPFVYMNQFFTVKTENPFARYISAKGEIFRGTTFFRFFHRGKGLTGHSHIPYAVTGVPVAPTPCPLAGRCSGRGSRKEFNRDSWLSSHRRQLS